MALGALGPSTRAGSLSARAPGRRLPSRLLSARSLRAALCWAVLSAGVLAGCGGAAPVAPRPAVVRPTGEARSFLEPRDLRLALDHRVLRMLPFADDVGALYRTSGLFQRFAGGALLDPLRDIDLVGASTRESHWGSRGVRGERWRIVLRHRLEDDEALRRLERGALDNGEALRWRESQGLRSALLPGEISRGMPHVVLLSAAHEVVVVPEDELIDAVTTVRDHAARRLSPDEVVEPALRLGPRVFAVGDATTLPSALETRGAVSVHGTARWTGARAELELTVRFLDSASAASAELELRATVAQLRGNNPFLVTLGLAGWLDRLAVVSDGDAVTLSTSGDAAETGALVRSLAALAGG